MNTSGSEEDRSIPGTDTSSTARQRSIPISENRLDSRDLFARTREITIVHGDDVYRLRLTAQNKLLLTK